MGTGYRAPSTKGKAREWAGIGVHINTGAGTKLRGVVTSQLALHVPETRPSLGTWLPQRTQLNCDLGGGGCRERQAATGCADGTHAPKSGPADCDRSRDCGSGQRSSVPSTMGGDGSGRAQRKPDHPHPAVGGSESSQLNCEAPGAQEKPVAVSIQNLKTIIPHRPALPPGLLGGRSRGSLLGTH